MYGSSHGLMLGERGTTERGVYFARVDVKVLRPPRVIPAPGSVKSRNLAQGFGAAAFS